MQLTALTAVKSRIRVGAQLPFNVRDADRTLLLARGQQIDSAAQLEALFERGALVDLTELLSAREQILQAPREAMPRLWTACIQRVHHALVHLPRHGMQGMLDDASVPVIALIERDPDLAIFQVLRQDARADVAYGVRRSVSAAICAVLVAQRLGWSAGEIAKAFKVALTMNLSMLELQGELARQPHPPTPAQQEALRTHPLRSAEMLELAGIADRDWLQGVARHHEREDGSGYPTGCNEPGDLASLARRADVYTGKLASRTHREALAADQAGRQMFMEDPGHPMTAALVKEFGIYPPGCFVRLASGEVAIVVGRGASITTPLVACLTSPSGAPIVPGERRATSRPEHAVVAIVGATEVGIGLPPDKLLQLAGA